MDPMVTVVIPCRNEAPFIRLVIESVLRSAYPRERFEVLFVDGMSTDGTRGILAATAKDRSFIRVLDNPRRVTPAGMNVGIKAARGEIIVRLDAHSSYDADYIPRCVRLLLSGDRIGSAGGRSVIVPNGDGPWAKAVAFVTAHRFGMGGGAYKASLRPGAVDTVALGTFRREVLESVGLYDERLTRNQDNELHARLKRAGYSVIYDPAIIMYYRNQATLKGLVRQGYRASKWNVYTLVLHPYTWKLRRFVPMLFVVYLAALGAAAWRRPDLLPAAAAPLGLYALMAAAFSLTGGRTAADRLRVGATFVSYHLAYGVGPFIGLLNVLTGRWREHLGRPFGEI